MKEDDYEIKFWKDWINADTLQRLELVKKLPIFDMSLEMKNKDHWRDSFSTFLNGYFEDLESTLYTKARLDQKRGIIKSHKIARNF